MQGWYSSSYGSRRPSWALQYTRDGPSAGFGTLLASGPYAGESATLTEHVEAASDTLEACVGGATGYVVSIPHDNAVAATISSGGCPG